VVLLSFSKKKNKVVDTLGTWGLLRLWKLRKKAFLFRRKNKNENFFSCSYFECNQSLLSAYFFSSLAIFS